MNFKDNYNSLFSVISNTPPDLLYLLMSEHRDIKLEYFLDMIKREILKQEQKRALIKALTHTRKLSDLLLWALRNEDDEALLVILESNNDAPSLCSTVISRYHPHDHFLEHCKTACQAQLLLEKLPENLRYELIARYRFNSGTPEIHAAMFASISNHKAFADFISTDFDRLMTNTEFINTCAKINRELAFALVKKP